MPGIPTIYYGSEWGATGDKSQGDPALRPCFDNPEWTDLTDAIAAMVRARQSSHALQYGAFKSLVLTNRQCVFERESDRGRVLVAINADENPFTAHFDARAGRARDLISGAEIDFGGGLDLPGYTAYLLEPF
ncbi:MAG: alpha amylase C-terminal domain-containing protein, partial [Lachnospiraceae bacterium]|nr:alpha amylase C-terminal domain-containing protein [Lachnospiraceae bacterium]